MNIELVIFLVAAILVWVAGVTLAKATDSLDCRFKIGDDFGGLILLGIVGSLPNLAVALSAAADGHIQVITGNFLGGIAIQTLVIAVLDFAGKNKYPLSYLAGSAVLSFEAVFVIIMAAIVLIGTYIPPQYSIFNMNPVSPILPVIWVAGLYLINRAHKIARFNLVEDGARPGRLHHERRASKNSRFFVKKSNAYVIFIFILASIVTLAAGILLEESGAAIAQNIGISSGIFAATAIALVTSLPEISTGIEAVLIGDNHLAISDIWGGNIFMLVPFFAFDLMLREPVLSHAQASDRIFAVLGMFMAGIYAISFLVRLRRRYFRLGLDSICEICVYAIGVAVLGYFT